MQHFLCLYRLSWFRNLTHYIHGYVCSSTQSLAREIRTRGVYSTIGKTALLPLSNTTTNRTRNTLLDAHYHCSSDPLPLLLLLSLLLPHTTNNYNYPLLRARIAVERFAITSSHPPTDSRANHQNPLYPRLPYAPSRRFPGGTNSLVCPMLLCSSTSSNITEPTNLQTFIPINRFIILLVHVLH